MKLRSSLILTLAGIIIATSSFVFGVNYGKQTNQQSQVTDNQSSQSAQPGIPATQAELLPKEGTVTRIIDGDTVELVGGKVVRFVGANAPEINEPFHDQALEFTNKLLLNQKVTLEYEKGYEQDKFGRLLAYVFVGNKNMSIELVKVGLAKVSIYEKRRPLIYQDQLIQVEKDASSKKLGVWKTIN